jgi:hypothetical protein
MRHSLQRYEWLRQRLDGAVDITAEDLKAILLSKYPDGLCCHYYNEYLGTAKSMVIDPVCGTVELCWGGRPENGWHAYNVREPLPPAEREIDIILDSFSPEIVDYLPLNP